MAERQENTRARLAFATVALFGLTVFGAMALVGFGSVDVEDVLSFLQPIIPAETGLAASAFTYYFTSRDKI